MFPASRNPAAPTSGNRVGARRVALALAAIAALVVLTASAQADDVADYLDRLGMTRLLLVHLEEQLDRDELPPSQRQEALLRLARMYASMLETEAAGSTRDELSERAAALLATLAQEHRNELELALLRAEYRLYEQTAEQHRLRLASEEELEAARSGLGGLIQKFDGLRKRLEERAAAADRRVGRATGRAAVVADEQSQQLRRLLDHATFLNAWALYYQSWLHDRPENARAAEPLFAFMLQMEESFPDANDVSVDLRGAEAFARSILGMSLCKTLSSNRETAIEWIELLQHENTYEPLRAQADAWKSYVLMEFGSFDEAAALYDARRAAGAPIAVAWMRLMAVAALEARGTHRRAEELARRAVADLAADGELRQVLDLANRYGMEALGSSGFAMRYVQGVLEYEAAREAHGADRPTIDAALGAQYESAAAHLLAAYDEPDAGQYDQARASTLRLAAMCRYYQSRFLDAQRLFERAAEALPRDQAEEALWMAIVCLDMVSREAKDNAPLAAQLAALTARFLAEFPSSAHAPTLALRQVASESPSRAAVQRLLSIPPNSDVYDAARLRAAEMLFLLYRSADESERADIASEHLSLAMALHGEYEAAALTRESAVAAEAYVRLSRQILEVALSPGVSRTAAATTVFASLDRLAAEGELSIESFRGELDFRRVQLRLLQSDRVRAAAIANRMWERDPGDSWARYAARAMFRDSVERWNAAAGGSSDRDAHRADVIVFGERVLREFADQSAAMQRADVMGYFAIVASAYMQSDERAANVDHARRAMELYELLLAQRERNREFLRAAALLSERVNQPKRSLEHWRLLLAGSAVGGDEWFEAKFHVIDLLSRIEPAKAREVMDQHKQLHPDFGPNPWGARLRMLDERMRKSQRADAVEAAAESGGA